LLFIEHAGFLGASIIFVSFDAAIGLFL